MRIDENGCRIYSFCDDSRVYCINIENSGQDHQSEQEQPDMPNIVKRYDLDQGDGHGAGGASMMPMLGGDYVTSSDYDALLARAEALAKERDQLAEEQGEHDDVVVATCEQRDAARAQVKAMRDREIRLRDALEWMLSEFCDKMHENHEPRQCAICNARELLASQPSAQTGRADE